MNALVIGRTLLEEYGEANSRFINRAESAMYIDWFNFKFDGVIFKTHEQKFGNVVADYVLTTDMADNHLQVAKDWQGDGKLVLIGSKHWLSSFGGTYPNCVEAIPDQENLPRYNSGVFALWYASQFDFENIYTVGLDFVNYTTQPVHDRNMRGLRQIMKESNSVIYKKSSKSLLPCSVGWF